MNLSPVTCEYDQFTKSGLYHSYGEIRFFSAGAQDDRSSGLKARFFYWDSCENQEDGDDKYMLGQFPNGTVKIDSIPKIPTMRFLYES